MIMSVHKTLVIVLCMNQGQDHKRKLYMLFSYREEKREFHYILYSILILYLIVDNMIKLSLKNKNKIIKIFIYWLHYL